MNGYVHHSKRPQQPTASSPAGAEAPADPRVPARMAHRLGVLEAALRREQTAAAQAEASRAKALNLADENAKQNRQLQTQLEKLGSENHALRAELTDLADVRDANTALLADIADLARQVTQRDARIAELEDATVSDMEAKVTVRIQNMTSSRVDAHKLHSLMGAVGDVITLQANNRAEQAAAPHLRAVSA